MVIGVVTAGARRRGPGQGGVPSPLLTKVTPVGSGPISERAAVGLPVVVTVKVPGGPTVNVWLVAEVMAGAASTVRANDWEAAGLMPLVA